MPLLGFTKLLHLLLNGHKTQTIRLPRKHALKTGDRVFIYWKLRTKDCCKLGEGRILSVQRMRLLQITGSIAWADGFLTREACITALHAMHPETQNPEMDVIRWEWTQGPITEEGR